MAKPKPTKLPPPTRQPIKSASSGEEGKPTSNVGLPVWTREASAAWSISG